MVVRLFEDDDAGDVDDCTIEIDKEFARRYEHNKKREDLQRYQELKKKGEIQESSESEDSDSSYESDTDIINPSTEQDTEFFKNLIKVRNRDPSLYQNVKLFQSDSDSDNDNHEKQTEKKEKKGKNAVFLKDVVAQHLIEEGPEFDEVELIDNENKRKKTYNEEQEEIKKEFLDAVKSVQMDDDGDDFLKVKPRNDNENTGVEGGDDREFEEKLGEYFGEQGELDENKMFLKEFFMNKMWLHKGIKDKEGEGEGEGEELDELLKDEEEIERQEKYEEGYNFRYEENAGDRVMGHARKVEGSVRKKENARKEQRKHKEDRMKVAEMERKEELKHLKNLKKKEMEERMKNIMDAAGIDDCPLDLNDLEEDFNPEAYDKMMKKAFSEKYYETEDVDPNFGRDSDGDGEIEKPDFDKEDELLGLAKDWDVPDSGEGFLGAREKVLKLKAQNSNDNNHLEERSEESKRKRKRKMSLVKKAKEEMMEEYYKLDYEGTIGDLKTRFKYAKVNPNRYGLKNAELLMMDEKELNQYVSIKKLAPYQEKEWKIPNSKRHKLKEAFLEKTLEQAARKKNKSKRDISKSASAPESRDGTKEVDKSSNDMPKLSRTAKRRHRQKELKLQPSRSKAYMKMPPKAKAKAKR